MYKLITATGEEIPMPDEQTIRQAVLDLTAEANADSENFLILERGLDDDHFIQTAFDLEWGFVLEYQDGGLSRHYECTEPELGADHVIVAFQRYAVANPDWDEGLKWQRLNLSPTER